MPYASMFGLTLSPQVDLLQVKTITGIATQGNPSSNKWTKTYLIRYRYGSSSWAWYKKEHEAGAWKVCMYT